MRVGIVGGGIMGLCLGYFLAKAGVEVQVYETSPQLGGLAGPVPLPDGTLVDRFYHAILSSDSHLIELCQELGIAGALRFKPTRMAFYAAGRLHSMNSTFEFLRFPLLNWVDRFRLGLTVLAAQFISDWRALESVNVEAWLLRWSGRSVYANIWRPLLRAKFDGDFTQVPATYIWSRLVRMKSTRRGASQREEAGHLIGGYRTLVEALAEKIRGYGGGVHLSTPVSEVVIEDGRARGLRLAAGVEPFDSVTVTLQTPLLRRLAPAAPQEFLQRLDSIEYLGIVAPLLVLDRPLSGYWTVNITDERIPFTGLIETTSYIDPQYTGGHHLVYLPKYTAPGSPLQRLSDDEIRRLWLEQLQAMFPGMGGAPRFDPAWVRYFLVHRERFVEPLHGLNQTDLVPPVRTPVAGLYLASAAQIYPALTNGESVSRHARQAAELILERE